MNNKKNTTIYSRHNIRDMMLIIMKIIKSILGLKIPGIPVDCI